MGPYYKHACPFLNHKIFDIYPGICDISDFMFFVYQKKNPVGASAWYMKLGVKNISD